MVMVRSVVLFNFKLRKTVLVEYSHPKRYYSPGEKDIKKHFLVYSKNSFYLTEEKQMLRFNIKI